MEKQYPCFLLCLEVQKPPKKFLDQVFKATDPLMLDSAITAHLKDSTTSQLALGHLIDP